MVSKDSKPSPQVVPGQARNGKRFWTLQVVQEFKTCEVMSLAQPDLGVSAFFMYEGLPSFGVLDPILFRDWARDLERPRPA